MDSPWHGFLIEVGSKSILGPIFMLIFCSICARAGTSQARLPTEKRREVGPTPKKFTGPQYKSIPLVCCRSQPRLPTFVISKHLELGAAGRVLGTADEVVLPPTRPQRRRGRKRAASVHAPWGGALGRGAADPPGSTWLT